MLFAVISMRKRSAANPEALMSIAEKCPDMLAPFRFFHWVSLT
jgi:hypothetical protein